MSARTLVTGFPRIGENRELKRAVEDYWDGKISSRELHKKSGQLRKNQWLLQKNKGIDLISCNDFSLYDNMLDTAIMLGAIPERFKSIKNKTNGYFTMARGDSSTVAMEMTKWFNTNYHYIVPELDNKMNYNLDTSKIISEYKQAKGIGIRNPKINIIGPLTFLALSKTEKGVKPYDFYGDIIAVYTELFHELKNLDDVVYIQMEEPIFVADPTDNQLELLNTAYLQLAAVSENLRIIFTTYFEHSIEATEVLADIPIWGIALDFVYGKKNIEALEYVNGKKLIAGIVNGRNVWHNNFDETLELLEKISQSIDRDDIIISTSCSLLHVPYNLDNEPDSEVNQWLSFAYTKLDEIRIISNIFHAKNLTPEDRKLKAKIDAANREKKTSEMILNRKIVERIADMKDTERKGEFSERIEIQKDKLKLPLLPTTTIGSFPQTKELRNLRRKYNHNEITREKYVEEIKKYIDYTISFQEQIDLDVLVHGEPERNDMVEYFGELMGGFHFTENGWVQSYGSRCVKPPIIFGDVSRPFPMTVDWISYAQEQTDKIVKGMLTGPVTILKWSFVREDKSNQEVSRQIAVALRDEIKDLQAAGINVIQVDEPAFKEGYPLRTKNVPEYEKWAVANFKLAVSMAKKETQIHTHMCYSNFNDIIHTIEAMDADVITMETARSGNDILNIFKKTGYKNEIGPGVYDIHSPRIPSEEEFEAQIRARMDVLPKEQLWVNPDCGLKTRKWDEVKPALENMVKAVKRIRSNS